ncbi:MAG: UPF0149 family protein [Ruminobacter sp.]|nr:UPF0149 family protein [Ruminobacter sp.]
MQDKNAYRATQQLFANSGLDRDDVPLVGGMILGMLVSGVQIGDENFKLIPSLALGMEREDLDSSVIDWINNHAKEQLDSLVQFDNLELLIPNDEAHISNRMSALIEYVSSFLTGFGSKIKNIKELSSDLQEALNDLIDITKLDPETLESNDAQRDLMIIESHVVLVAQMCFEECCKNLYKNDKKDQFVLEEDDDEPSGLVKLSKERELAHEREAKYWEKQAKMGDGRK